MVALIYLFHVFDLYFNICIFFTSIYRPSPARPLVYGAWSWFFRVKLHEAERPYQDYENLTAFFTRRLRDGARNIDHRSHVMVSPVDGAVVSTSADMEVNGVLSQVKGISYHISDFLGIPTPKVKEGNALFSAVLYLSPGDYHRFHSPTEWIAKSRTHFAGQLLPVNPLLAYVLPSLFCANERVAVFGEWEHGFYSYTAVGATNVGSIRLSFDDSVVTNTYRHDWDCTFNPLEAVGIYGNRFVQRPRAIDSKSYDKHVFLQRGDDIGLFELGSTIVLIFEAPKDFQFSVRAGDKVRVGQSIGRRTDPAAVTSPVASPYPVPTSSLSSGAVNLNQSSTYYKAHSISSTHSTASTESVRSSGATDEELDIIGTSSSSSHSSFSGHPNKNNRSGSSSSSTTSSSMNSKLSIHLNKNSRNGSNQELYKLVSKDDENLTPRTGTKLNSNLGSPSITNMNKINGGRMRSNSAFAIMEGTVLAAFEEAEVGTARDIAPCDLSVSIPTAQLRRMVVDSSGRPNRSGTQTKENILSNSIVHDNNSNIGINDENTNEIDNDDDDFLSCCSWEDVESGAAFVMAATLASQSSHHGQGKRSRAPSNISCSSTTVKSNYNDPVIQQFSKLALVVDV